MTLYDLTVPISPQLPVWPGDPPVELTRVARVEEGAPANLSRLAFGTHVGTHVDPPYHLFPGGQTLDETPLERLIGPAWVSDCRGEREVTRAVLEGRGIPAGTTRLLLLTDNSACWSDPGHVTRQTFVDLAPSGAEWLVERGVGLVGIDYLSVDHFDDADLLAHHVLLSHNVLIIENIDLRDVPPDREYELLCLPLKIVRSDGAPARVVLRG